MRMERKSPSIAQGHSVSLCENFVVGAVQLSWSEPGPIMMPKYFPAIAQEYFGKLSFSGRSILVFMSCKGSSQSGMFFVFFMLTPIVVILLYVVMMV